MYSTTGDPLEERSTELSPIGHTHLAAAVAVKLPTFWAHSARLWFAQAEAQFALSKITSSTTKFYYTIAALTDTVAAEVDDLLEPHGEAPYEHLKFKLLERFMPSTEDRFRALMQTIPLGDQRPTCLLREMQRLATGLVDTNGPFFRRLFLLRLPPTVQLVLKAKRTTDIEELARAADELVTGSDTVNLVTKDRLADRPDELERLQQEVDDLRSQLRALTVASSRRHSPNKVRPESRTSSPHAQR